MAEHRPLEVTYVRQGLAHLRLGLYNRTLEPDLFHIFRQCSVERAGYRAELWIIGASHVMNVQLPAPGMALAEVLTGTEDSLPSEGRIEIIEKVGNRCGLHHAADRLNYTARLDSFAYPKEDFRQREADLLAAQTSNRLSYRFPAEEGLLTAPVTVLDVLRADENALEVQTFHTYPEELTIVITHSVVEVIPT